MAKSSKTAKTAKTAKAAPKAAKAKSAKAPAKAPQAENPASALPYRVHAQFLNDVSFENPGILERIVKQSSEQLKYNIHWHIGNQPVGTAAAMYQAELRITLSAHFGEAQDDKNRCFVMEISMMALVEIAANLTDKQVHQQILRMEIPRLLYPYMRSQIDALLQEGGYAPMRIQPLNFVQAYQQYMQQQNSAAPDASPEASPEAS